jgi:5-methylcytosine-specific restriction endonuclease McrA
MNYGTNKANNNKQTNEGTHLEKKGKDKIPKALREQVWIHYLGNVCHAKCPIIWCKNRISAFDFHVGHNVPESRGGTLDIKNLMPICSRCNLSMSDNYTIDEWNMFAGNQNWCVPCCCVP